MENGSLITDKVLYLDCSHSRKTEGGELQVSVESLHEFSMQLDKFLEGKKKSIMGL